MKKIVLICLLFLLQTVQVQVKAGINDGLDLNANRQKVYFSKLRKSLLVGIRLLRFLCDYRESRHRRQTVKLTRSPEFYLIYEQSVS